MPQRTRALAVTSMGPLSEESGEPQPPPQRPPRLAHFNGAALRRERRAAAIRPRGALGRVTSMGPLSEESGEHARRATLDRLVNALQWGRSPKRAERSPSSPSASPKNHHFNGAALRRERRVRVPDDSRFRRELTSMGPLSEESGEAFAASLICAANETTSMGPLSEESGEMKWSPRGRASTHDFNGAALRRERRASRRWRPTRPRATHFNGAALRRERRAPPPPLRSPLALSPLQWGRSPKRAERRRFASSSRAQKRHFNGAALRRERRGPLSLLPLLPSPSSLQWGRSPKRAERRGK